MKCTYGCVQYEGPGRVLRVQCLTDRERQILELAAGHLTSKQIGPLLGIQPASVDTFMQTIIKKLGVTSRKEAVIAYLAYLASTRDARPQSRDDLDFGSSPMSDRTGARPTGAVIRFGDERSRSRRVQLELWRAVRTKAATPVWRLVAIAVVAMVMGFVTLGAVAAGYGLTHVFDRLLADQGLQPRPERPKSE